VRPRLHLYLSTQLNFPINQIIAAGAPNLATVYRTLTGDPGNPYPSFSGLLEKAFPSSVTASISGPVPDDPFPLLGDGRFRAAGISALHPRTDEGAVSLYVIGIDGKVWSNFWPAGNTVNWNGWFPIGDNVFPQGSPISALHPRTDEGAVSLYVIGIDNKVWSNFWPAGKTANWNGWFPVGANVFPQGSPISAIHPRTDEGAVSLYLIGIDGKVWSNFWPAGNTVNWNGWFPIGNNVFPLGFQISALHPRTDEGAVSLYLIGIDGKVWSNFWPAGNTVNWNGWFPIGGNVFPTYVRVQP
jgi:hypothetical protein